MESTRSDYAHLYTNSPMIVKDESFGDFVHVEKADLTSIVTDLMEDQVNQPLETGDCFQSYFSGKFRVGPSL